MKAIRDKIPFDLPGRRYGTLDGEAFLDLLVGKLYEEANEVATAVAMREPSDALVAEELADLIEVAHAIAYRLGISSDQLHETRMAKLRDRGTFNLGHVIS